jgi:hypothetical protein
MRDKYANYNGRDCLCGAIEAFKKIPSGHHTPPFRKLGKVKCLNGKLN